MHNSNRFYLLHDFRYLLYASFINQAFYTTFLIMFVVVVFYNIFSLATFSFILITSFSYGLAFIINDYADIEIDRSNQFKKNRNIFLIQPEVRKSFLLFVGVAYSLVFGFFAIFGVSGVLLYVVAVLVAFSYSFKPVRFKRKPGLDVLIHGLFVEVFPVVMLVILFQIPNLPITYVLLSVLFINSIINQMSQQLRDYEADQRALEVNFTQTIGKFSTLSIIRVLHVVIVLILGYHLLCFDINLILFLQIILFLPFFVLRFHNPILSRLTRAILLVSLTISGFMWIIVSTLGWLSS